MASRKQVVWNDRFHVGSTAPPKPLPEPPKIRRRKPEQEPERVAIKEWRVVREAVQHHALEGPAAMPTAAAARSPPRAAPSPPRKPTAASKPLHPTAVAAARAAAAEAVCVE